MTTRYIVTIKAKATFSGAPEDHDGPVETLLEDIYEKLEQIPRFKVKDVDVEHDDTWTECEED